jgi:hypothetical protein
LLPYSRLIPNLDDVGMWFGGLVAIASPSSSISFGIVLLNHAPKRKSRNIFRLMLQYTVSAAINDDSLEPWFMSCPFPANISTTEYYDLNYLPITCQTSVRPV